MKANVKTKIAIFIMSLFLQAMNTIALALSGIAQAFPEASVASVQMVLTLATLVSIAGNVLCGKLAAVTTKKKMVIIFSLLLIVGALFSNLAANSIAALYAGSAIIGLSAGLLIPVTTALIAEHFEGTERAAVIGQQTLFVSVGAILLNMVAGILAVSNWRNVYFVFLSSIVVIVVALFMLPKGVVEKADDSAEAVGKPKAGYSAFVILPFVQAFLFGIGWTTFMTNITMYVDELGMDPGMSTIFTMAQSAAGAVIGLCLSFVMRKSGKYCFVLALALGAAGLWLMSAAGSVPLLLVATLFLGMGFGLFMPSGYTLIPSVVNPAAITMSMSLFLASFQVGAFVNPYIVTVAAGLLSETVSARFLVAAVVITADVLLSLFCTRKLAPENAAL